MKSVLEFHSKQKFLELAALKGVNIKDDRSRAAQTSYDTTYPALCQNNVFFKEADVITIDTPEVAKLFLNHAPFGVYWTCEDGRFLWFNQSMCEMLGYKREELLNCHLSKIDPKAGMDFREKKRADLEHEERGVLQREYRRKDGSVLQVEVTTQLMTYLGQTLHLSFVRDLTHEKKCEKVKDLHVQFLTRLFQDSPLPQLVIDPETAKIVEANHAAEKFYGYEKLSGMNLSKVNTLDEKELKNRINEAVNNDNIFFKFKHRLASGEVRDVHVYSGPVRNNGQVLLHSHIEDMTPIYQFQHELQAYYEQVESLPVGTFRMNLGQRGLIETVNATMCEILDASSKDDIIGSPLQCFFTYPEEYEIIEHYLSCGKTVKKFECQLTTLNGRRIWTSLSLNNQKDATPSSILDGTIDDITNDKKQRQHIQQAEAIIQHAAEGITITGPDRKIVRVNPSFTRITGYSIDEVYGKNPRILSSGRQNTVFYKKMWDQIDQTGHWQGEIWNRRKTGEIYPEWLSISAIRDPKGTIVNYAAVFTDLSSLNEYKAELENLQNFDPLTGLLNKQSFLRDIVRKVELGKKTGAPFALIVIGFDRFHFINETFGYEVGDAVLQKVSEVLQECLDEDVDLGRIGGDQFAFCFWHTKSSDFVGEILKKIRNGISDERFSQILKSTRLRFGAGVSYFPSDFQTGEELLHSAETAMYEAKRDRHGSFAFVSEETKKRYQMEVELGQALEKDEIEVFFQPIVSVSGNRILGAEGLARWTHHEAGPVAPDVFIGIAESSGIIDQLTDRLLDKAAVEIVEISKENNIDLKLSFNVSMANFIQGDFAERLVGIINRAGLDCKLLEIELTETVLMKNKDEARAMLDMLRYNGVSITIDDFGTGFSSLSYLQSINAQVLKIDKTFTDDVVNNRKSIMLLQYIISMGHALDMKVTAEGVEIPEQLALLEYLDCDFYQGYLFSKPLSVKDFRDLVKSRVR